MNRHRPKILSCSFALFLLLGSTCRSKEPWDAIHVQVKYVRELPVPYPDNRDEASVTWSYAHLNGFPVTEFMKRTAEENTFIGEAAFPTNHKITILVSDDRMGCRRELEGVCRHIYIYETGDELFPTEMDDEGLAPRIAWKKRVGKPVLSRPRTWLEIPADHLYGNTKFILDANGNIRKAR